MQAEVDARGVARRGEDVAVVDVEHVGSSRTAGKKRRNAVVNIQCVVAGRPSSRPAAASTNAPVQIDIKRASRPSSVAARSSSSPPRSTAAPRCDARDHDRVGGAQDRRVVLRQHRVTRRRPHRTAVEGRDTHAVERRARVVHGAADQLVRQPQLERDDRRQHQDGDLMTRHGRILSHVVLRATICAVISSVMLRRVTELRLRPRIHSAWWAAAVSFIAILGAAGFRSVPGVMMIPLHTEFGWSTATVVGRRCRST